MYTKKTLQTRRCATKCIKRKPSTHTDVQQIISCIKTFKNHTLKCSWLNALWETGKNFTGQNFTGHNFTGQNFTKAKHCRLIK
jgi:uncharacterized protein YjbI with pentapeptide repeats